MSKSNTAWSSTTKETTNFSANSLIANATKLNNTVVTLNSLTVQLTGYTPGSHFNDNKSNTNWSSI